MVKIRKWYILWIKDKKEAQEMKLVKEKRKFNYIVLVAMIVMTILSIMVLRISLSIASMV